MVSGVHAKSLISFALLSPEIFPYVRFGSISESLHSSADKGAGSRVLISSNIVTLWFFSTSSFRYFVSCSSFIPFVRFSRIGTSPYLSRIGVKSLAASSTTGPLMPFFVKIRSPKAFIFAYFLISTLSSTLAIVSARQCSTQLSLVCRGIIAGCSSVTLCPLSFAISCPSPSAPSVGYPSPPVATMMFFA